MGLFRPDIEKMKANGDIEGLIEALQHKDYRDYHVQIEASNALVEIGELAVEPLIQTLLTQPLQRVDEMADARAGAASTLGDIGDKRAVKPLIQALRDDEFPGVRVCSALALGKIGDARAVESLIQALKDENEYVREAAKEALEKIKAKKN